jgi:4-diphosphocytidyl-2-methyl-D-erithritol synthase
MIHALILAGGIGTRVGADKPKQFIEIGGKPILIHTLDKFQKHPSIDRIAVVCVEGWEEEVRSYRETYGLSKLESVVTGGRTALESIRRGVDSLASAEDDIIVIHDGVRPLVDEKTITNVIIDCRRYGGAISAVPLIEHVFFKGDEETDLHYIPRENAYRTVTPQAYTGAKIRRAFRKSDETGIGANAPFIGIMMVDLGEPVCLSQGSEENVKITDPKDINYFKSLF